MKPIASKSFHKNVFVDEFGNDVGDKLLSNYYANIVDKSVQGFASFGN